MLPGADESCTELLYATCRDCVSSVLCIHPHIFLLLEAEKAFSLRTRRAILPPTGVDAVPKYGTSQRHLIFFCCSFFRSMSEKTNNRYNGKYHAPQAKKRLYTLLRLFCRYQD